MASSDTLQGFENGFSNTSSSNPFYNLLDGMFSGLENIWKGVTGQSSNEKINAENVAMQQKNLDYQMALQQQIFNREDTSYARTVRDMRSSGLNPLSMKGTNGTGSVVPTQAPQKQFESINSIPLITQALSEINSLSVGQAQRDNINAQTRNLEIENAFKEWELGNRKAQSNSDTNIKKIQSYSLDRDYHNNVLTGQGSNQFLSTINQGRIAIGKKPIDSATWTDFSHIDFNDLVDQARFGLTMDMIDKIGNLIPKDFIKIGK